MVDTIGIDGLVEIEENLLLGTPDFEDGVDVLLEKVNLAQQAPSRALMEDSPMLRGKSLKRSLYISTVCSSSFNGLSSKGWSKFERVKRVPTPVWTVVERDVSSVIVSRRSFRA